ncbi:MAG: UvrD-helicase domain-containing protein [Eubacteriales bacterium]|nr:UvrD-helicase domain-containing protein [Eubacteriales bacterium]
MNNQVVFAAAGNGKTYSICKEAKSIIDNGKKMVLLISYTNEGVRSLGNEYRKQNQGVLDERLVIKSWYSFLLSEFIKPYQCLLKLKYKHIKQEYEVNIPENHIRSIAFYQDDEPMRWYNQTHVQYFLNSGRDVIPDRASLLACKCNEHSSGKSIKRMEEIYSHIFIDELQDYAGWDLEIIKLLFTSAMLVKCVGDYKQATYRTNNTPKYSQYRDEAIREFFIELEKKRLCTVAYSNITRRFNQEICDFINTIHADPESIVRPDKAVGYEIVENQGVYILDYSNLDWYCKQYEPVILRYDKKAKIPFNHECCLFNYGGAKGATYERTVIIPVSTTVPFLTRRQYLSTNQTRSKFYVACTRAKHSVVFAVEKPKATDVFKQVELNVAGEMIPALKYYSQ